MKQHYKKIALLLVFLFALPVITAACCCTEPLFGKKAVHHSHHNQTGSSHDHNLCNHGSIVSHLANQPPFIFAGDSVSKFLRQYLLSKEVNDFASSVSLFPSSDHGPPGFNLSEIPLYLQISALRI